MELQLQLLHPSCIASCTNANMHSHILWISLDIAFGLVALCAEMNVVRSQSWIVHHRRGL